MFKNRKRNLIRKVGGGGLPKVVRMDVFPRAAETSKSGGGKQRKGTLGEKGQSGGGLHITTSSNQGNEKNSKDGSRKSESRVTPMAGFVQAVSSLSK